MHTTAALAILMLATATGASPAGRRPAASPALRPLSARAAALVADATARSATVKAQLEILERTDLVVYVRLVMDRIGSAPRASTQFLVATGGLRYLLIEIDQRWTTPVERIEWLGHELQHTLEVAASDVTTEAGFEALYRHIGWEGSVRQYETEHAVEVGRLVRREIRF
jgi:hypothetical protein